MSFFIVFPLSLQSEEKKIILVKSSLREVRFTSHLSDSSLLDICYSVHFSISQKHPEEMALSKKEVIKSVVEMSNLILGIFDQVVSLRNVW